MHFHSDLNSEAAAVAKWMHVFIFLCRLVRDPVALWLKMMVVVC